MLLVIVIFNRSPQGSEIKIMCDLNISLQTKVELYFIQRRGRGVCWIFSYGDNSILSELFHKNESL